MRDGRELYEVEGHLLVVPCTAPTADERGELGLKEFYVVGVRFALIPYHATQGEAFQGGYACFKEVAGLVGVTLQGILAQLYVI